MRLFAPTSSAHLTMLLCACSVFSVLPASQGPGRGTPGWDDTYAAIFEAYPGPPVSCSDGVCIGSAVKDSKHQLSILRDAETYQAVRDRLARNGFGRAAFRVEAYGSDGFPCNVVWAVETPEGVGQVFWVTSNEKIRSRRIPAMTWFAICSEIKAAMGEPLRSSFRYSASSHPRSAFVSVRIGERSVQFILNPCPPGGSNFYFEHFWRGYEREVAVVEAILNLSPDRRFYW